MTPRGANQTCSKGLAGLLALFLLALNACTSIPVEQREERRDQIDADAAETIELLRENNPGFQQAYEGSAGYFTARISSATVAVVGGGKGIGVLVDRKSGHRSYMDVKRFDLGAGLGAREYRVLFLAEDEEALENIRSGKYFKGLATEMAAGQSGGTGGYVFGGGRAFYISDTGASIAATARVARISVNADLTDTGLSEISIPNTGFGIDDGREADGERVWDRKLPFLAQDVIDLGYDLPRPYGIKLLYSGVDQAQNLDALKVGFSGSEKVPYEWVAFENARSDSSSYQLIGDLWLFPFMNLFAYVGDLEGDAPMDVILEGNGMLEQLGINCSLPGNLVLCNLLQDRLITLPIDANFSGVNYGIGFNLAGGWKGFFFTLPVSFSWIDMDTTTAEGKSVLSASPRVGRVINLGNAGNLAWYVGASYLDSDLRVTGSLAIPETDVTIDYTVDQSNKDPWAGVVGFNWDINGVWSIQAEYNGFFGTRDAVIASVNWRF